LDMSQLQHLLRSKGVFSIEDCAYAILETDGSLSVLKKSNQATPTREDLNLPQKQVLLPISVINDEEIMHEHLKKANLTEHWLQHENKELDFNSNEDTFHAEWTPERKLLAQYGKGNMNFI